MIRFLLDCDRRSQLASFSTLLLGFPSGQRWITSLVLFHQHKKTCNFFFSNILWIRCLFSPLYLTEALNTWNWHFSHSIDPHINQGKHRFPFLPRLLWSYKGNCSPRARACPFPPQSRQIWKHQQHSLLLFVDSNRDIIRGALDLAYLGVWLCYWCSKSGPKWQSRRCGFFSLRGGKFPSHLNYSEGL